MIDLIFCAAKNKQYAKIAISTGYQYGAQLPNTVYYPPFFVDQDWKNPDREAYLAVLAEYRPSMASVLDLERVDQLPEVLAWAEDAAPYVETIIIIPKAQRSIELLPCKIGSKRVRLGYSVPTSYGGTALPYNDFRGWPVHLLGGSPHKQMRLTGFLNVVSADGNMIMKMANSCRFWRPQKGKKGHWVNMYEVGDGDWGIDANYEAFRRSCMNIMQSWRKIRSLQGYG